jgi:hypothetical protein
MNDAIPIQSGDKVARSRDKKAAAITWPRAVDRRLDQLQAVANDAGDRTTRAELAAAIISDAEADPERLRALLTAYRKMTNAEVLLDAGAVGDVVQLPVHRPGPRQLA